MYVSKEWASTVGLGLLHAAQISQAENHEKYLRVLDLQTPQSEEGMAIPLLFQTRSSGTIFFPPAEMGEKWRGFGGRLGVGGKPASLQTAWPQKRTGPTPLVTVVDFRCIPI